MSGERRRRAPSPWLSIPAADYEGHMGSPEVGQLQFLSEVFRAVLAARRPRRVAVLGCATGNGFEHLAAAGVERVAAVDLNPDYLEIVRARWSGVVRGLELVCADAAACELDAAGFDLVSAALVFEYVDPSHVIPRLARWLAPGGTLSVVLQLPSPGHGPVSETPFASLKLLEPVMHLVDPRDLAACTLRHGLVEASSRRVTLASGKGFFVGEYVTASIGTPSPAHAPESL